MIKRLTRVVALGVALGGAQITAAQVVSVTPATTHCFMITHQQPHGGVTTYGETSCSNVSQVRNWQVTHEQSGQGLPKANIHTVYESAEVDRLLAARDQRILLLEQTLDSIKATLLTDNTKPSPAPAH